VDQAEDSEEGRFGGGGKAPGQEDSGGRGVAWFKARIFGEVARSLRPSKLAEAKRPTRALANRRPSYARRAAEAFRVSRMETR
jgi:hypothetical protein